MFGPIVLQSSNKSKHNDILENQLQSYLAAEVIDIEENPLLWWKNNGERFPHIANIARKMLCIPATSVPSERVFSDAGNIITTKRAQLKCDFAEKLILMYHNRK